MVKNILIMMIGKDFPERVFSLETRYQTSENQNGQFIAYYLMKDQTHLVL